MLLHLSLSCPLHVESQMNAAFHRASISCCAVTSIVAPAAHPPFSPLWGPVCTGKKPMERHLGSCLFLQDVSSMAIVQLGSCTWSSGGPHTFGCGHQWLESLSALGGDSSRPCSLRPLVTSLPGCLPVLPLQPDLPSIPLPCRREWGMYAIPSLSHRKRGCWSLGLPSPAVCLATMSEMLESSFWKARDMVFLKFTC